MVAAAKTVDARTRSLELAEARGYWSVCPPGRSMEITLDDGGKVITYTLCIPSASQAGVWHLVTCDVRHDDARCDCPAARCNGACWHRGIGVRSGRYIARLAQLGWPED